MTASSAAADGRIVTGEARSYVQLGGQCMSPLAKHHERSMRARHHRVAARAVRGLVAGGATIRARRGFGAVVEFMPGDRMIQWPHDLMALVTENDKNGENLS